MASPSGDQEQQQPQHDQQQSAQDQSLPSVVSASLPPATSTPTTASDPVQNDGANAQQGEAAVKPESVQESVGVAPSLVTSTAQRATDGGGDARGSVAAVESTPPSSLSGNGESSTAAATTVNGTAHHDDRPASSNAAATAATVPAHEPLPPAEAVSLDVGENVTAPKAKAATDAATATSAVLSPSSPSVAPAKKFTSLNVNKKFLEKASPAASSPGTTHATAQSSSAPKPAAATSLSQTTSRLSTTASPASRLTSAKLSAAGKPQPASWASPVAGSKAAAAAASPMTLTASQSSAGSQQGGGASSNPASTSPKVGNATPRLATALSSGTAGGSGRAGSPHLTDAARNSPGIRNATLGSLNRAQSPATSASGGTSTAPWANLKPASISANQPPRFANPDFPTAAEAAAAKKAQEEKEKQEAAEAAARHEAHLRQIDRFRGTGIIGSGRHWDELDDDDDDAGFLDEVVEFADGTKYTVPQSSNNVVDPAKLESEIAQQQQQTHEQDANQPPITKDQRFKDVDHDRSWPMRGAAAASNTNAAPSAAPLAKPAPAPTPAPAPRSRTTVRETLDIMPGTASIALDDPMARSSYYDGGGRSRMDRDSGGFMRGGSRFDRGGDYGRDPASAGAEHRGPPPAAVRAWGPLAVRQQSLNPNAPKVEAVPPAAAAAETKVASPPTAQAAPAAASAAATSPPPAPSARPAAAASTSPTLLRRETPREAPQSSAAAASAVSGRGLPPHLALQQQQQQQRSGGFDSTAAPSAALSPPAQSTDAPRPSPWGRRSSSSAQQQASPAAAAAAATMSPPKPAAATASSPEQKPKPADQATEMLSAAERARRRRQEEEAAREAEKERARQKALAIEEKMRKQAEEKAAAERAAKEKAAEEKRQKEEARLAAERAAKAKREEEEAAAAAKRANVWRPKSVAGLDAAAATAAAVAPKAASPAAPAARSPPTNQPPVHSVSDEATSWRRAKQPAAAAAASPPAATHASPAAGSNTAAPPPASSTSPRSLLKRSPAAGLSPAASDNMANLDDVIGRIRGAMQNGGQAAVQAPTAAAAAAPSSQPPPPVLSPQSPPRLLVNHDRAAKQQQQQAATTASASAPPPVVAPKAQPLPTRPPPMHKSAQPYAPADATPVPPPKGPAADRAKVGAGKQSAPPAKANAPPPPAVIRAVKELPTTREEQVADDRPAWNRFKVSLKPSAKRPRLGKHQYGLQKARMAAAAASENSPPAAPYALTWEPPIPGLSWRTLNRDDLFFAKKFNKGKVISPVVLPSKRLQTGPAPVAVLGVRAGGQTKAGQAQSAGAGVQVRLPGSSAAKKAQAADVSTTPKGPAAQISTRGRAGDQVALDTATSTSSSPFQYGAPAGALSRNLAAADQSVATRPELDFGAKHRRGPATTAGGVAFAQNAPVADIHSMDRNTPSPVNFMVTSELESSGVNGNGRGASALMGRPSAALSGGLPPHSAVSSAITRSASHTPLLPGSGLGSSTWGQGPLSFLDTPKGSATPTGGADAGRIKDVWARPDGQVSSSNSMTPTQNSLRDIGDDFLPATLAMSLNDLKVDDAAMTPAGNDGHLNRSAGYDSRRGAPRGLGVGGSSAAAGTSGFRTPSASATLGGDRSSAAADATSHLSSMANSPQGHVEAGHGSNSAPSTSPNMLRSSKSMMMAGEPSMNSQRGSSSLYPSAYIDAAADPFTPSSRSSSSYQYGSDADQGQHAIYSSLGPVETGGFGTENDGYGSSAYGASAGYGASTWSMSSPASASSSAGRGGPSNAFQSGYTSGPPTGSRMPFVNNRQHQQGRGGSSYNYNGYGSGFAHPSAGSRNNVYSGMGSSYRGYPGQQQQEYGVHGGRGQTSSGGLSSPAYGASREGSLASAVGSGSSRGQLAPHQQQPPPHFSRYGSGAYGGSQQHHHHQQQQYGRENHLSSPFNNHKQGGEAAASGYPGSEHPKSASSQATAASLWRQ